MHFLQNVVAVFFVNSKSSWIFRSWGAFTLKSQCPELLQGTHPAKAFRFWLYFLNSRAKMEDQPLTRLREWNWQLCIQLLFTWFPILSRYSLPFGLLVVFVIRFCLSIQRAFVCLHFLIYWSVRKRIDRCSCSRQEDFIPQSSQLDRRKM